MSTTSRETAWVALALTCFALAAACDNRPSRPNAGECDTDSDCTEAEPFCNSAHACVGCIRDSQCECHEICDNGACAPFGAAQASQAVNAHGRWDGTPGTSQYAFIGTCANDDECNLSQICNPFTASCIDPGSYPINCSATQPCPGGLVCDDARGKCLPSPLCRGDYNCCGGAGLVCDDGSGLCRQPADECTPPTEVATTCPMQPRQQDVCNIGEFCSLLGECVECVCDGDCGGVRKCYQRRQQCKDKDYCEIPADCAQPLEGCDTANTRCAPACTDNTDCAQDEYCDIERDLVCRNIALRPCDPNDGFEPNQTPLQAVNNGIALAMPPQDSTVRLTDFSLCNGDVDWFTMALVTGDRLVIAGSSQQDLAADLTVFAPDAVTSLDTGFFGPSSSGDTVSFTVSRDGLYYFNAAPTGNDSGFYDLSIQHLTGTPCLDPFEDDNGWNDRASDATLLYDYAAPATPLGCTVQTSGAAEVTECLTASMCPGDVDYYVIGVPNGGDLAVSVRDFAGDLDLFLYGPFADPSLADTAIVADQSRGPGRAVESVAATARPEGFYLVKAERAAGSGTSYTIEARVTPPATSCVEDPYDAATYNDARASATQVKLIGNTDVILDNAGAPLSLCRADNDWYELGIDDGAGGFAPLPANHRFEAELLVAGGQTGAITLAGGTANVMSLGSDDPSAPELTLYLGRTESGQSYFLRVLGAASNPGSIDYTLRVRLIAPPPCGDDGFGDVSPANNDAPGAPATPLLPSAEHPWPTAVGGSYEYSSAGLSLCAGNDDWYSIELPPGSQLFAWVEHDPSVAEVGLRLFSDAVASITTPTAGLAPATGLLDSSQRPGLGLQHVRGSTTGDAYIMVTNRTGWPLPDYRLGVRILPTICEEDPYEAGAGNDTSDDPTPVSVAPTAWNRQVQFGVLEPLTLCQTFDSDWYAVDLGAGDKVSFDLYNDPNEGTLVVDLYQPGGTNYVDWDYDEGSIASVSYTVPAAGPVGRYLLAVTPSGFLEQRNYYVLETRIERACVDDLWESTGGIADVAHASPTSLPGAVLCNDEDWYRVTGAAGAVTVCATFVNLDGDIDLEAYPSTTVVDGAVVGSGTRLGDSLTKTDTERMVFAASDPFFVRVFLDWRDHKNTTYDLTVLDGDVPCP